MRSSISTTRQSLKTNRTSQSSATLAPPPDSAVGSISDGSSSKHSSLLLSSTSSSTRNALPSRLLYLPHTLTTVRALLHYLYTLTLPPASSPLCTIQVLTSLLLIATPYNIHGLLEVTLDRLHQVLDGPSVVDVFNAAALAHGDSSAITSTILPGAKDTQVARSAYLRGLAQLPTNSRPSATSQPSNSQAQRKITAMSSFDSTTSSASDSSTSSTQSSDTESGSDAGNSTSGESDASEDSVRTNARRLVGGEEERKVWPGEWNKVVGLQKRALRAMWEAREATKRENRERERREREGGGRVVGLGLGREDGEAV